MPSIKITDLCSQQISLLAAFSSSSCFFCYSCKIEVIAVASSSDRSAVKPKLIGSLLCSCSSVLYVYCARMYRYYIGCCTVILSSRVCFCHSFCCLTLLPCSVNRFSAGDKRVAGRLSWGALVRLPCSCVISAVRPRSSRQQGDQAVYVLI